MTYIICLVGIEEMSIVWAGQDEEIARKKFDELVKQADIWRKRFTQLEEEIREHNITKISKSLREEFGNFDLGVACGHADYIVRMWENGKQIGCWVERPED